MPVSSLSQITAGNVSSHQRYAVWVNFISGKEIDYFLENLASLLSAGIPIVEALGSLSLELRSRALRTIIARMQDDIENGMPLSYTLERSGLFSAHVAALLRTGEKSGKLVENLKIIAAEEQKRRSLRAKVRSATLYPIFVMSLTVIIAIGIAWFILPKLATVFSQLKIDLPLVTRILIDVGQFLEHRGAYAVPLFLVVVACLIYMIFFFKKTRIVGEHILFILPGAKNLLQQAEMSRFGYLLGTLLASGLSPVESLHSLADATALIRYQRFYRALADSIAEGNSFKKSLSLYPQSHRLIPLSVQQLITAGEQSGSLSETLMRISQRYEAKTDTTAKDLAVMLEPVLLIMVWLGVMAVALAVILPIYSLVGQLNG